MPVGRDLDSWYAENIKDGCYCPRFVSDQHWQEKLLGLSKVLNSLPDADFAASAQAKELATQVAACLGHEFSLHPEMLKGHDFYRFRWSIVRNDKEVAWVGFLASSTSPRQKSQANTIHVNITGTACTFAEPVWPSRMVELIEETNAKITRCDLALDFFDGISGGLQRVKADYEAGAMKVRGNQPKCNMLGVWLDSGGHSRSFYIGSKEAGKQTNIYEKGHQLFGPQDTSAWQRIELRYGNKLRELSPDMLRRPTDFFAGASDWHEKLLKEHGDLAPAPSPALVKPRRALETVRAEVSRNIRWLLNTAAPSVALAFHHLGDEFLEIVTGKSAPGRLQSFAHSEVQNAYASAFSRLSSGSRAGGGAVPAFAP
ncbi:Replication initiation factor [Giesbergeria anulus]|uniref:Replication initiation factor n=2 Tax=Giesbergeria anulus TaxID=180197 RepID=A0A1H9KT52_9BURK|nr:Replication initiation factor [Giesbergeria anulus]